MLSADNSPRWPLVQFPLQPALDIEFFSERLVAGLVVQREINLISNCLSIAVLLGELSDEFLDFFVAYWRPGWL